MVGFQPLQLATHVQIVNPQPNIFGKGGSRETTTTISQVETAIEAVKTGMVDYNVPTLTKIWVAGLGIAVAPCIAWFAFRWLKGTISKALFKGRL